MTQGLKMRRTVSFLGWITLALALALVMLGLASWPPSGLMFALPYFFLIPGAILALIGGLLLRAGGNRHNLRRQKQKPRLENEVWLA
jgi:hypothetical protein